MDEQTAICGRCAVRSECFDYAIAEHPLEGLWAGTSKQERARMRRAAA